MNPAMQEILDEMVTQLSKAPDDFNAEALAEFLQLVPTGNTKPIDNEAGETIGVAPETLLDRTYALSRVSEAQAKIILRLVDARLIADPAWSGMQRLFEYLRQQNATEST